MNTPVTRLTLVVVSMFVCCVDPDAPSEGVEEQKPEHAEQAQREGGAPHSPDALVELEASESPAPVCHTRRYCVEIIAPPPPPPGMAPKCGSVYFVNTCPFPVQVGFSGRSCPSSRCTIFESVKPHKMYQVTNMNRVEWDAFDAADPVGCIKPPYGRCIDWDDRFRGIEGSPHD